MSFLWFVSHSHHLGTSILGPKIQANQSGYGDVVQGFVPCKTIDTHRIRRLEEAGFQWAIPETSKAKELL